MEVKILLKTEIPWISSDMLLKEDAPIRSFGANHGHDKLHLLIAILIGQQANHPVLIRK